MLRKTRTILTAIGAALALSSSGLALSSIAQASTAISGTTSVVNHPDTTNASSNGCLTSPNGPVWARDSFTSTLSAVSVSPGQWRVTLSDTGQFLGFADPASCSAMASGGNFAGSYTVTVASGKTPTQANLKKSYNGDVSTTAIVRAFFNDPAAVVTGGDYFFSYQNGNYVQTTSSIYGDVVSSPFVIEYSCGNSGKAQWNWVTDSSAIYAAFYQYSNSVPHASGKYNLSAHSQGTYSTSGKIGIGVAYHVLGSGKSNSWIHVSISSTARSC